MDVRRELLAKHNFLWSSETVTLDDIVCWTTNFSGATLKHLTKVGLACW